MYLELVIILVIAALVIGSIAFGIRLLAVNVLNPEGRGAAKKTARLLGKFALIRGFRVLSNVNLRYKDKTFFIENMMIGYFGILLVHTLGGRGEYYGQMDGKNWQRVLDDKKTVFPNPAAEQEEAMTALRAVFSQNKVFNIPMENIITLTNKSKKTALFITNDGKIFLPGKLQAYLDKTKFEKDTGIDVARLAGIIEANSVPVTKG